MELKSVYIDRTGDWCRSGNDTGKFYLKSEADKVIADKDEAIDELEERIDELQKATDSAWSKVNVMYDELRHHKYRRCLDRSEYWAAVSYQCIDDKHRQQAERHHKKWLELAEKFKPNNSTAQ